MRKIIYISTLIILFSAITFSCEKVIDNPDNTPDNWAIYIYGLTGCHLCTDFEDQLDQENIPYTFYDIDTNNVKRGEMMAKLQTAGIPSDSIQWPVVDVMVDSISHMFIQPDYDKDVKPLIGK